MASAPPLPTEFHRVVVVLDGARLKGTPRQRAVKYYRYIDQLKKLAAKHGAKVEPKRELHLKQRVINKRKVEVAKLLRRRSR